MSFLQWIAACAVCFILGCCVGFGLGYHFANNATAAAELKDVRKASVEETKIESKNETAAAPVVEAQREAPVRVQTIVQRIPVIQTVVVHDPAVVGPPGAVAVAPDRTCPAELTHADGVLLDAAARGDDPPTGPIPDGPAVPARDVTATVASNYVACNVYIKQITGLQAYIHNTLSSQKLLCPTH